MKNSDHPAIRKAVAADAAALSVLSGKTFYDTYHAYNTDADTMQYIGANFSVEAVSKELSDPATTIFICEIGNALTGYITLRNSPAPEVIAGHSCLEIARFYVDAAYQGRNIGSMLIQKAVDLATALQKEFIWLGVWQKNTRAIAIYQHLGFEIAGTVTFTYGSDVQDDYVMIRQVISGNENPLS